MTAGVVLVLHGPIATVIQGHLHEHR
jgi:hypothetical protein